MAIKRKLEAKRSRRLRLSDWSKEVRKRDGNSCVVCGKTEFIQAHHLLPKERYPELQYELMNGLSLCPGHHKWSRLSFHRNGIWATLWLEENRPEQYRWACENGDFGKTGRN